MDHERDRTSITSIVKCGVCKEIMKEPKALNCLHHFCDVCIGTCNRLLVDSISGINCPQCQKFTAENLIQSSHLMKNMLTVYNSIKECEIDSRETPYSQKCRLHPDNLLKYNCVPCGLIICAECKIAYHDEHKTEGINEALNKLLPQMRRNVKVLKDQDEVVGQVIDKVNHIRYNCVKMFEARQNTIIQHKNSAIAKIEEDAAKLIDIIETSKRKKVDELDSIRSEYLEKKVLQENTISSADSILQHPDNLQLVQILQDKLLSNIEKCVNDVNLVKKVSFVIPQLQFRPKTMVLVENLIGTIESDFKEVFVLDESGKMSIRVVESNESVYTYNRTVTTSNQIRGNEYSKNTDSYVSSDEEAIYMEPIGSKLYEFLPCPMTSSSDKFPSVYMEQIPYRGASAETDVTVLVKKSKEKEGPTLPPPRRRPRPSFRLATLDFRLLRMKKFSKSSSFRLQRGSGRICYFKSQFWCPCLNESRIDIYNAEGKLINNMTIKDVIGPRSLHPLNDFQMLLAARNGLYTINVHDGSVDPIFTEGILRDVHMNGQFTIALEKSGYNKDKVSIFNATLPLILDKCFMIDAIAIQRVVATKEHIFVSFHENALASYIMQYTFAGVKVDQHGRYGKKEDNELDCPYLCATDTQGSILIADSNNKQLKVLSNTKQWSVLNVKLNKLPLDAGFIGSNTLWVLCYDESKEFYEIRKFQY